MAKRRRSTSRRTLRRAPTAMEFNPDYTYIKQDLRRIAMLATGFIVALVALSFVIQ